jgi:hypothetical protein
LQRAVRTVRGPVISDISRLVITLDW